MAYIFLNDRSYQLNTKIKLVRPRLITFNDKIGSREMGYQLKAGQIGADPII